MVSELNEKLVNPTDLNQSYVRMVMISSFFIWVLLNERYTFGTEVFREPLFRLVLIAIIYACLFMTYAKLFLPHKKTEDKDARVVRYLGIVGDITACAGAVYFADAYGLLIYPVFITIVIGYGFRFGLRYFFVAEIVALTALVWLVSSDRYLSQKPYLSGAFIFGMLIIPSYSAFLLSRYQNVLVQLKETNQARSRFIANMSHELRTPLYAIVMNAESLLEKKLESGIQNTVSRQLRIISSSASHLRSLVERVLDIASGEAGTFVLKESEELDFYSLLPSAVNIGCVSMVNKNVEVLISIDPTTPRYFWGWPQQLTEILINTVGNAAKFTEIGKITVQTRALETKSSEDSLELYITVKDTGIGMTAEQLASAFVPFTLGDDRSVRQYEGTGIGLTITKQYVDSMGGNIQLESPDEAGVVVEIRLPCRTCEPLSIPNDQIRHSYLFVTEKKFSESRILELELLGVKAVSYGHLTSNGFSTEGIAALILDDKIDSEKEQILLTNILKPKVIYAQENDRGYKTIPSDYLFKITEFSPDAMSKISALCGVASQAEKNQAALYAQKILLIDDNENNLASAELVLRNAGHIVDSVTSGDEGISKLQQARYDLVFIDMHMPQKNGLETVLSARELVSGALPPIVFLTADVTAEKEINGSEIGISAFLTKPITPSSLRAAVERFGASSASSQPFPDTERQSEHPSAYAEIDDMLERGASRSAVANLIENYRSDINRNLIQCAVLAAKEDKKQVRKLVHRMQGSASAMHFDQLVDRFAVVDALKDEQICEHYLKAAVDLQTLSDTLVKDMKNYVFDES